MKKNLFITLMCVSIIASMCFATGASAIGTLEAPAGEGNWGLSLQQYSDRNIIYMQNWGGHNVWTARSNREGYGDCFRLKENGHTNWVYVGTVSSSAPSNLLTIGTTYTLSVDYAPGPRGMGWPSVGLKIDVGGQTITFSEMDNPNAKEWKTFSSDFTATNQNVSPKLQLTTSGADIYLDDLVITEKSTGNVVFYQSFDKLRTVQSNWGYEPSPPWYAETKAVPFYGIPGDDIIGVIDRGDSNGYAAYIRNTKGYEVSWRFSDMEAIVRALPAGTSCKVKYDYVYCDAPDSSTVYLADRMSWTEYATYQNSSNTWHTVEYTFSSASDTQCGFKIKSSCRMCVDNLTVTVGDNVIAKKDFNVVPLLAGPNQFIVEPATLSQSSSTMTVSAKVTNSYTEAKNLLFITAIYSGDDLEGFEYTQPSIAGDARGINHTTTVSKTVNVSGKTGKTFKAFLWDDFEHITALANHAVTKTIE